MLSRKRSMWLSVECSLSHRPPLMPQPPVLARSPLNLLVVSGACLSPPRAQTISRAAEPPAPSRGVRCLPIALSCHKHLGCQVRGVDWTIVRKALVPASRLNRPRGGRTATLVETCTIVIADTPDMVSEGGLRPLSEKMGTARLHWSIKA